MPLSLAPPGERLQSYLPRSGDAELLCTISDNRLINATEAVTSSQITAYRDTIEVVSKGKGKRGFV